MVGPPKTDAGIRDVTVPPHVAEVLRAHMKAHTGQGPESFVFTTTRGKRLSETAFTKTVKNGFARWISSTSGGLSPIADGLNRLRMNETDCGGMDFLANPPR